MITNMSKKSSLEHELTFSSKEYRVTIFPCGFDYNFRWHDYTLHVDDKNGIGELSFGRHRAIVDCKHHEHDTGHHGSMSVKQFKERFQKIIIALVPREIYIEYLSALDMGKEGIFKEADVKFHTIYGKINFRNEYLDPEK